MHFIVLISSTAKEDVGCNEVSLHKLELGDCVGVGFLRGNIGIQIAALPWQLMILEFGIAIFTLTIAFWWNLGCAVLPGHLR